MTCPFVIFLPHLLLGDLFKNTDFGGKLRREVINFLSKISMMSRIHPDEYDIEENLRFNQFEISPNLWVDPLSLEGISSLLFIGFPSVWYHYIAGKVLIFS